MSTTTDSHAVPFDSQDFEVAGVFETLRPRPRLLLSRRPTMAPTIAPLGSDRLIAVCYTGEGTIRVTGRASGRDYTFAAGEIRDIPLADARYLVTEENFAFTGGR